MMDVFIVEDEEMIRQLYRDVLSMRGHNIIGTAVSGEEAVEKFRNFEKRPDLIIMDHRLNGMDGLDAARLIMEEDPSTRIILVSADDNAVWEALRLGIVGVKKPFNIGDLLAAMETSMPSMKHENGIASTEMQKLPVERSGLYIINELDGEKGIGAFRAFLSNGYDGMAFTRKHPDIIRKKLPGFDFPLAWFTSTPVKDFTCISPLSIQKMLIMIQSAISAGGRSAILVWGFEYILTNIDFNRALNLIQVINDRVMTADNCVIIFSMDLDILGEREQKLIRREFEEMDFL
ncbi:hypothetical protein B6U90_04015 [Thermoplasmatales archaeon ex4484_6]|nr:MAG: hypothetical protein B6U90_04015 [Thermoplasmatales archaeon ex4484_6]RLF68295.1 MAG: hypothetical protein DRN57_04415 [Thermoplasmata archaeon]